ncbi:MAG: class I SAM-dependent methyltransferase [Bacteroidota bacterium]
MRVFFEKERALVYDNFISKWMPGYHTFMSMLPFVLLREKAAIYKVLIAGCGTGNELLALNGQHPDWRLTGIDPSAGMIEIGLQKTGNLKNIEMLVGTIDQLPKDVLYDAGVLSLVLHFLSDDGSKQKLLQEVVDRLHPKASLVLCDVFGTKDELNRNLDLLSYIVTEGEAITPEIQSRLDRIATEFHYIPEERLEILFKEVGLSSPQRFFQSTIYGGWIATKR